MAESEAPGRLGKMSKGERVRQGPDCGVTRRPRKKHGFIPRATYDSTEGHGEVMIYTFKRSATGPLGKAPG